jgi:hypothetical protein
MMPDNIEFPVGGLGEFSSWTLEYNAFGGNVFGEGPCKHAYDISTEGCAGPSWRVPRAASALTQCGYDGTSICVDCILEAVADPKERA